MCVCVYMHVDTVMYYMYITYYRGTGNEMRSYWTGLYSTQVLSQHNSLKLIKFLRACTCTLFRS